MEKKYTFTADIAADWTLVNAIQLDMIANYEIDFEGCGKDEVNVSIINIEPNSSDPTALEALVAMQLDQADHSLLIDDIGQLTLNQIARQREDLSGF